MVHPVIAAVPGSRDYVWRLNSVPQRHPSAFPAVATSPPHIEFLLFGWVVQLIMGVGFWIFPRFWRSRGNEKPAWAAFGLLNLGILLAGVGPVIGGPVWFIFAGRLAETAAAVAFVLHAWPRIKPPGAHLPSKAAPR